MEKNVEALRHTQAKIAELEKTNKRLYEQGHENKKEVIKLKEEVEILKVKVLWKCVEFDCGFKFMAGF